MSNLDAKILCTACPVRVDECIGLFVNGNFNENTEVEHRHALSTHLQLFKHMAYPVLIIFEVNPNYFISP